MIKDKLRLLRQTKYLVELYDSVSGTNSYLLLNKRDKDRVVNTTNIPGLIVSVAQEYK